MAKAGTQRDRAIEFLRARGIIRLSEFKGAGITAATISRLVGDGEVLHLSRGLYQLPDAPLEANHSLAEAAKRVPKGVVCLVSALAYHELTDQLPRAVWMAIGTKDWAPKEDRPPMRIVRFTEALLADDVVTVHIENVPVKIFGIAKTIADCFRHRRRVGQTVALEGLQEALRQQRPPHLRSRGMRSVVAWRQWSALILRRSRLKLHIDDFGQNPVLRTAVRSHHTLVLDLQLTLRLLLNVQNIGLVYPTELADRTRIPISAKRRRRPAIQTDNAAR